MAQSYYLMHYGIEGQKWGVRRYQNPDGSWTDLGNARRRLTDGRGSLNKEGAEHYGFKNGNRKMDINQYKEQMKNGEISNKKLQKAYREERKDLYNAIKSTERYDKKTMDQYELAENSAAAKKYVDDYLVNKYGNSTIVGSAEAQRKGRRNAAIALGVIGGLAVVGVGTAAVSTAIAGTGLGVGAIGTRIAGNNARRNLEAEYNNSENQIYEFNNGKFGLSADELDRINADSGYTLDKNVKLNDIQAINMWRNTKNNKRETSNINYSGNLARFKNIAYDKDKTADQNWNEKYNVPVTEILRGAASSASSNSNMRDMSSEAGQRQFLSIAKSMHDGGMSTAEINNKVQSVFNNLEKNDYRSNYQVPQNIRNKFTVSDSDFKEGANARGNVRYTVRRK